MIDVKLNFVIVCDNAFVDKDGKASIIGIFENIKSDKPTAIHPRFSVITKIQGKKGKYKQALILKKNTEREIVRVEDESEIKEDNSTAIFVGHFLMTNFDFPNTYIIDVEIDDKKLGDIEINAVKE